jgi:outer membrane protein insertion porin family
MLIKVKIKIAEIDFIGNEKLSDKTLRKAMKDTNKKKTFVY